LFQLWNHFFCFLLFFVIRPLYFFVFEWMSFHIIIDFRFSFCRFYPIWSTSFFSLLFCHDRKRCLRILFPTAGQEFLLLFSSLIVFQPFPFSVPCLTFFFPLPLSFVGATCAFLFCPLSLDCPTDYSPPFPPVFHRMAFFTVSFCALLFLSLFFLCWH